MEWFGIFNYLVFLLILGCIYALITLGLNVQWGFAGLFNIGISGFFAIGAYTAGIATAPLSERFLGGFGLSIWIAVPLAMLTSMLIAWPIAKVCLRFRSDYLAIVTIGIAEMIRLIIRTEDWLSGGPVGITSIPRPFGDFSYSTSQLLFLSLMVVLVAGAFILLEKQLHSPWGRMMRAIRDNEVAASSLGKDIENQKLIAFIVGCAFMGLAGAMFAFFNRSITPEALDPLTTTFLVWIMLILGGSGNNKGALVGTFLILAVWSMSEIITDQLPSDIAVTAKYFRIFLVGLVLQLILRFSPEGIFPEQSKSR